MSMQNEDGAGALTTVRQSRFPQSYSVRRPQRNVGSFDGGCHRPRHGMSWADGQPRRNSAVERAAAFVRHDQTEDGSWFGRWGVNYVYGTSGVLRAFETLGLGSAPECKRVEWLRSVQNLTADLAN